MHYLTDAILHTNKQPLGQALGTQLPALEEALQAQQDISFSQGNGMLLSLIFPDVQSGSDTLMALLAAAKPPTLLLFADDTLKAWFVLNEPCDPKRWQKLGEAIAHHLGGKLEPLDALHPLPGVMSTILYQAEKPHALGALERAYLPRERKQPASQDNRDVLRDMIQATDLPALVAHHYPASNAKPGTVGAVKAVWRGDENPSFSLFQADDGMWLYRDHGTGETGNSFGFLVDILGVGKREAADAIKARTFTGLNLPPAKAVPTDAAAPKKKEPHVRSQIVKTYAYNDETYHLVFEVVRFHPKRFAQRRRDPETNKWIWGLSAGDYFIGTTGDFNKVKNGEEPVRAFQAVTPILYHLPELLVSKQQNATVFLVEGEKDVETLEFHGFVSTCNPMGAQKWLEHYTNALKDREVVLLPDNDDAGRGHAALVQEALEGHANSLKLINLPDLKDGEDVTDWFGKGNTAETLNELVNPNRGVSEDTFETMKKQLWEVWNSKSVPGFMHPGSHCQLEPHNATIVLKNALEQPNTKEHRKVIHNAYQALSQHAS